MRSSSVLVVFMLLLAACTSADPAAELTEPADQPAEASDAVGQPDEAPTPFALLPPAEESAPEPTVAQAPTAVPEDVRPPVPTPTVMPRDPSIAWSAADSTRDVENFLEALRAGAFEQAAWPAWGNGVLFDGQSQNTTGAEFLAQVCAGGLCDGPYVVRGQPGVIDPETMRAVALVTVTHIASGQQTSMPVVTFEGQRIIGNLPPLVTDTNEASFLRSLFGDAIPNYVVIERFEAFEIWQDGASTWHTHWDAEIATQIEGNIVVSSQGAFLVTDPTQEFVVSCPRLLERSGNVLAHDTCVTDQWVIENLTTVEPADLAIAVPTLRESESPWLAVRGGTLLVGARDSEGNLRNLESAQGVDLLSGDYAGTAVLSTDGAHLAYVDHGDPDALSHFWSSVVVVREVATGNEVGRWSLNGSVICLEFAVQWVVACEANDATLATGDPDQRSLVSIDITTGETTSVPTSTRVFLPVAVG